jgi:hypothetical protein
MLENVAAVLMHATEAFAREDELTLKARNSGTVSRYYFNVIVTTAKLETCVFDPAKISLSDGMIEGGECNEVPYIRFRKQLSSKPLLQAKNSNSTKGDIVAAKENTVFVVNAENLQDFLSKFYF